MDYFVASSWCRTLSPVWSHAGARRCDHITPVLRQLHWLPVHQRVVFKITVPRRRLSPSVGRWSSPNAVQSQWRAEAARAANRNLVIGVSRSHSPVLDWERSSTRTTAAGTASFDYFTQSLKSYLFGDRRAYWLYWIYKRCTNKNLYIYLCVQHRSETW